MTFLKWRTTNSISDLVSQISRNCYGNLALKIKLEQELERGITETPKQYIHYTESESVPEYCEKYQSAAGAGGLSIIRCKKKVGESEERH